MDHSLNISSVIEFEDLKISFLKENIFFVQLLDEAVVNGSMQARIGNSIQELKPNSNLKYPLIVELGEFVSITDNLIDHSDMKFSENVLCISVFIKRTSDRLLAKYYSNKFSLMTQFSFFTTLEEAIKFSKSTFEAYQQSKP